MNEETETKDVAVGGAVQKCLDTLELGPMSVIRAALVGQGVAEICDGPGEAAFACAAFLGTLLAHIGEAERTAVLDVMAAAETHARAQTDG